MRALPKILREKPESQIVIIGGDGVSYGAAPDANKYGKKSWKQIFVDEIAESISDQEKARIHFLGRVPYELYKAALQISSCHVYFTYPFVLSWSLLEAMSIGCPIVASDTAPVLDAIEDGVSGLLGDFFDPEELAVKCIRILNDIDLSKRLCSGARQRAVNQYDLRTKCLPEQLNWVQEITAR
jgi:glycosyltransferase involved in cell wall biosynthesis